MMRNYMRIIASRRYRSTLLASSVLSFASLPAPCWAQEVQQSTTAESSQQAANAPDEGLEDIVVTAQKRGVAEAAQDVPIAITAITGAELDARAVRDLSSLTTSIPNVSLESSGAVNGQANFEIRGFGISSSIPSVEPAVGVFIDGIYQGVTYGLITDMFDVQSVEVLRGPQGTLFGRNTTGGAVSITTRRPGNQLQVRGRLSLESGPAVTAAVSVGGPIVGNDVRANLAAYYSYDDGYFFNRFNSSSFGRSRTYFVRPTLAWDVTDRLDTTLIFEHGRVRGDGPPSSNTQIFDGANINIDHAGITYIDWERLTSETNLHVGFGDGVITNVMGWGWLDQQGGIDTDGLPSLFFNINERLQQNQFSEELRYAGRFGRFSITVGVYYFEQEFTYVESRDLNGVRRRTSLGGAVDQEGAAGFGQIRFDVTPSFSLIAGGRYSWERKTAQVAGLNNINPRCDIDAFTCNFNFPGPNFTDDGTSTWSRFSPKLGFQWRISEDMQLYGHYSEGIRSGGYNVRSSAGGTVPPGPYDQEIQDAFEVGFKSDLLDRHLRINAAGFFNRIGNLQRDISTPDPLIGSAQITANVGTAEIYGFEVEVQALLARGLRVGAHLGYLNGQYTELTADLNGALAGLGLDLQLVRLPKFSYGASFSYEFSLTDSSELSLRSSFGHVDRAAAQDNNTAFLSPRNIWDANITYTLPGDQISLTLYAKNILDDVNWSTASARAATQGGGVYLPLTRGRVIGGSLRFQF